MTTFISLGLLALLAVAVTVAHGDTPPPASAVLSLVQVVTRHGDRTPTTAIASDPATWICHASTVLSPLLDPPSHASVPSMGRLFNLRFIDGRQPLAGNCSTGQLTNIGQKQQLMLGAELRKRYVEDVPLLPGSYDADLMYVRATDVPRTIMSAEELINGMYPMPSGSSSSSQVVATWTIDTSRDPMSINPKLCPAISETIGEFLAHNLTVAERVTALLLPFVPELDRALQTKDPLKALAYYDNINCRVHHDLPLPGSPPLSMAAYHALYAAWNEVGIALFHGSAFSLGPFYATLLDNMAAANTGGSGLAKFRLFSGHDTSVGPLLAAMGLWTVPGAPSNATVRVLYLGKPVVLPACAGAEYCPLATFAATLKLSIPDDYQEACKIKKLTSDASVTAIDYLHSVWR
ncbi:counting factor 60 [Thecamonas trahens ATCC 50062]|uniref:Counting factor 60 n=1 Tax=Thecamonas trahens ATCC 50062 TaxID=461836 RepID=A0A0L0DDG0_THETB|nr:counting factor 60 [Thecamonas trahens ATCC 50062]KNC50131.1 counting factor 60 [Thecamonas trahens ATCC 50062]|eukprot:XP_013757288.1 counting factor 60 [Thecamonas trahens ATCC 50062]